jgi:hypothetical protein
MSYETEIVKALAKFGSNSTANPDAKHNTGSMIGEAFMWDKIEAYAKARADAAWLRLAREGIIKEKKALEPGDHELAASPSFLIVAKVTQPIKRFSADALANMLAKSKYKVPVSTTKELIDQAKVAGTSAVTMKVLERG